MKRFVAGSLIVVVLAGCSGHNAVEQNNTRKRCDTFLLAFAMQDFQTLAETVYAMAHPARPQDAVNDTIAGLARNAEKYINEEDRSGTRIAMDLLTVACGG